MNKYEIRDGKIIAIPQVEAKEVDISVVKEEYDKLQSFLAVSATELEAIQASLDSKKAEIARAQERVNELDEFFDSYNKIIHPDE
jgi:chromosome segregation ATPase